MRYYEVVTDKGKLLLETALPATDDFIKAESLSRGHNPISWVEVKGTTDNFVSEVHYILNEDDSRCEGDCLNE